MAEFTFIELHIEDGSFWANLPFSGQTSTSELDGEEEAIGDDEDDDSGGSHQKGLALLGVLVLLVIGTALAKYLSGEEEEADDSFDM